MQLRLTKRHIDEARPESSDIFLWDAGLAGFGVRVKPSGAKAFVVQYRNQHGRSRRHTIGRYGTLTLDEARREARQLLSAAARGHDPRQERIENRAGLTIDALAARYMSQHCKGRCKPSSMQAHQWLLNRFVLPKLGRRLLCEVSQADIDTLHQELRETPYNANRVLGLVRAMYGRAETWNLVPRGSNPALGVQPFREHKRQRFLSAEEFGRLARALREAEADGSVSPYVTAAYRMLIATGARLNEIRLLRWSQIDWHQRLIILTEHKGDARGAKAIPLNSVAVAILKAVPPVDGNPYVIAGAVPGQPAINLQKPWRRIRARAKLEDVRLHDLRHSFASFGIGLGTSLPIIGGLLGHRSLAATSTYAHLAVDPLRDASEQVARLLGPTLLAPCPGDEPPRPALRTEP